MYPWKLNQQLYHQLVTEHEDAMENFNIRLDTEVVENALRYFKEQSDVAVYPSKSYAIGIIYATFLSEWFGVDFYDVLDDPDLFLGMDEYFKPYRDDKTTYDKIIEGLKSIPDWRDGGWAPKSFRYCYLECTEDGIEEVTKELYTL